MGGGPKMQTVCDNGSRRDSKHTHHSVQYVAYPAGMFTHTHAHPFFQQPLKSVFFLRRYSHILFSVAHHTRTLSANKFTALLSADVTVWSKRKKKT